MEAGPRRHRITIQQKTAGSPQQNAAGEPDVSWTDYLTTWASIRPVTGKEPFLAQEHLSVVSHKIGMNYRSGITAAMRVVYAGRYFNIVAPLNFEERNKDLLLLCEEGANNG